MKAIEILTGTFKTIAKRAWNSVAVSRILLVVACLSVMGFGRFYGTRFHTVWPDESWLIETAATFVSTGTFASPSHVGSGYRLEEGFVAMPPVHPLMLAGWFKLTGRSDVESGRLYANVLGVAMILCVYAMARLLVARGIVPGLVALLLSVDVPFHVCINVGRPEVTALAWSLVALMLYLLALRSGDRISPRWLAGAMLAATLGMLAHPIDGAAGFFSIPAHALLSSRVRRRDMRSWAIMAVVPLIGVAVWLAYACRDFEMFQLQFIDLEVGRKASSQSASQTVGALLRALTNFGVKGYGAQALLSSLVLGIIALRWFGDRTRDGDLLLALAAVLSGFAVNFGREMWYPCLRMPFFYLAVGVLLQELLLTSRRVKESLPSVKAGLFTWCVPYAPLVLLIATAIGVKSTLGAVRIVKEVRTSERAAAYDREQICDKIVETVPEGATLGFMLYPACDDRLRESGHFGGLVRFSYHNLSKEQLTARAKTCEYAAISEQVLDARYPWRPIDLTLPQWGGGLYLAIMASEFHPIKRIETGEYGSVTVIYRRRDLPGAVMTTDQTN